jgi:hypothetical protein
MHNKIINLALVAQVAKGLKELNENGLHWRSNLYADDHITLFFII